MGTHSRWGGGGHDMCGSGLVQWSCTATLAPTSASAQLSAGRARVNRGGFGALFAAARQAGGRHTVTRERPPQRQSLLWVQRCFGELFWADPRFFWFFAIKSLHIVTYRDTYHSGSSGSVLWTQWQKQVNRGWWRRGKGPRMVRGVLGGADGGVERRGEWGGAGVGG